MPAYTSNGHHSGFNDDETSWPRCVEEYLAYGVDKGDRNNTLFHAACQCLHAGLNQAEVEALLLARATADGLSEREARRTIESAFGQERRAPPSSSSSSSGYSAPCGGIPSSSNTKSNFRPAPKMHAAASSPYYQPQYSGQPLPSPIKDGFRVLLENCFLGDERIVLGKGTRTSQGDTDIDAGTMCSRDSWLKRIAVKPLEQRYAAHQDGLFLRANPMKGAGKRDADVDVFRYALVEFDLGRDGQPIAKEIQYEILSKSGFSIGAIIDSGNKSLQGLIRLDAANRKEFDTRCRQVIEYFSQFDGFDDGNKNPSRYFRCPDVGRALYDKNGKFVGIARQELLKVKLGPNSWAEYEKAQAPTDEELEQLTLERRAYYTEREQPFPAPMAPEAYYGITGEIVNIIKPNSEACPESILVQVLLGLMNIIGRIPYCRQAGVHHLNEYVVLAGETSTGCKGTSWDAAIAVLEAIDSDWVDNRIHTGIQSGEVIITWVRDSKSKIGRNGKRVIDQGVSDKRLLIFEDEFPRLLVVADRKGSTLSAVLRTAFDGKKVLENGNKNDPEQATGALVSVLGHGTPKEIRDKLSAIEATNGFANRMLFIATHGVGEVPIPPAIDWAKAHPEIVIRLRKIVENFQSRPQTQLVWTQEGKAAWEEYYKASRKRKASGLINAITRRRLAHTLRLTMGYALLDNVIGMSPQHLAAAKAIVDYSERSVQWIFGEKLGERGCDKIFWELDRRPSGMTRTEIADEVFSKHISATDLNIKLTLLRDNGLVDYEIRRHPGTPRPVEHWFSLRYRK